MKEYEVMAERLTQEELEFCRHWIRDGSVDFGADIVASLIAEIDALKAEVEERERAAFEAAQGTWTGYDDFCYSDFEEYQRSKDYKWKEEK